MMSHDWKLSFLNTPKRQNLQDWWQKILKKIGILELKIQTYFRNISTLDIWKFLSRLDRSFWVLFTIMDEDFNYIEDSYRSAHPFHHYGFILFRTFGTALAAILLHILLHYILLFIRHIFRKYLVQEDVIFWVDIVVFLINLCTTAALAFTLDRRFKRYWFKEVLLKFAAEDETLNAKYEL